MQVKNTSIFSNAFYFEAYYAMNNWKCLTSEAA